MQVQTQLSALSAVSAAEWAVHLARRHGVSRLALARAASLAAIAVVLALFAASIPVRFAQLVSTFESLSPAQELVLNDLGLRWMLNAGVILAVEIGVASAFVAVGMLIFSKRSDDPMALFVAAGLPAYAAWASPMLDALGAAPGPLRVPTNAVQALGFAATVAFFYVFPSGSFEPRWTRWLVPALIAWCVTWVVTAAPPFDLSNQFRLSILSFVMLMAWLGTGIAAQLYRYARVATPVQRQQTKLILFGSCVGIAGYLCFGLDRFALPVFREAHVASVVYDLVGVPLFLLVITAVPVSFAISILRYRLWEIEELIGRAFLYAFTTAILGGLYTTSITLSQRLFVALTGEKSDSAIVITTLIVASSFVPIKNALQGLVDRRLKHRPDNMTGLTAFTRQVRAFVEDVDVDLLTRRALEEAAAAFGATSGAVYLRRGGQHVPVQVLGDWDQVEGMSAWLESSGARYGWLTLGPRASGQPYTAQEQATLQETATVIGRAIWLLGRSSLGGRAEQAV